MQQIHYKELLNNINCLNAAKAFDGKDVVLFGLCNATEEAFNLLCNTGVNVKAILDNNTNKQGQLYKGIPIRSPYLVQKINLLPNV